MEVRVGDVVILGGSAEHLAKSQRFWKIFDDLRDNRFVKISLIEEKWSSWKKGELAFALFLVHFVDEDGNVRVNIVFCRSDAVAVFIVLKDRETQEKSVVLVEQLRVPAGQKLLEIPAGGIEGNEDPLETTVREIQEEVGLHIEQKDLRFMGRYFLSPGACNEKIFLYSCEIEMIEQEIKCFEGRLAGLHEEGEHIKVRLFPLNIFRGLGIRDAKTQLAYELYLFGLEK